MDARENFLKLIGKYISSDLSPEERRRLFNHILSGEHQDILSGHIHSQLKNELIAGADLSPHRAQEIIHKILSAERQTARIIPRFSRRRTIIRRMLAVSAAAAIVPLVLFLVFRKPARKEMARNEVVSYKKDFYEKENNTSQPVKFQLEDASTITLKPGSKLSYPAHFLQDKREVYLEGEAFFEVSKNPRRPFYVYNENLVTHVLGTSFTVKTNKLRKEIEVAVRTGRVEVYEKPGEDKNNKTNNGVILTPNQKVIYALESRKFESTVVDMPLPIVPDAVVVKAALKNTPGFIFDAMPLSDILISLRTVYGIDIETENDSINNCLFTGDISNQNLFEKLDILCQTLNTSYETKGTRILIRGRGCN
jgi:hypothetical protein